MCADECFLLDGVLLETNVHGGACVAVDSTRDYISVLSDQRLMVSVVQVLCKRNQDHHPYKVIDVTPPSRNLGVRCFPSNMQCGECVTIEDKAYIVSAVTYRYQLRKGKYEPSEKRLDVQSTGRYLLNNYLEMLLEES
ncbi:hypothetical protein SUGI_0280260 [Cryptomeria japonica]|nr:hypothetical protein SUGI_0280260 [Cryptomeria japonica]